MVTTSGNVSLSDFTKANLYGTNCPQRCSAPPGWLRARALPSHQQALLPLGSHSTPGCSPAPFCFADLPAAPQQDTARDRACCRCRKALEKEHPIPGPRRESRAGSTETLAAARAVWAGQCRRAGAPGGRNGDGRCHSSCSSFFWKAWSLLATVCWMISSPSASSSFMSSRMAFRTLFLFLRLQSVS